MYMINGYSNIIFDSDNIYILRNYKLFLGVLEADDFAKKSFENRHFEYIKKNAKYHNISKTVLN